MAALAHRLQDLLAALHAHQPHMVKAGKRLYFRMRAARRRRRTVALAAAALALAALFLLFTTGTVLGGARPAGPTKLMHVAVSDGGLRSDIVQAGVLQALSMSAGVQVTLLDPPSVPSSHVLDTTARHLSWSIWPRHVDEASASAQWFAASGVDVYLATSCERELLRHQSLLEALLSHSRVHLYCLVRKPALFEEEAKVRDVVAPWISQHRIRFLALNEGSARTLADKLAVMGVSLPVGTLAPVADLPDKLLHESPQSKAYLLRKRLIGLVMPLAEEDQGQQGRARVQGELRDATRSLSALIATTGQNAEAVLLGGEKEDVAPTSPVLHHMHTKDSPIDFLKLHELLATTAVVVPVAGGGDDDDDVHEDDMLAIPAAISAGTPVVVTPALMQRYSYLSPDAVVLYGASNDDDDGNGDAAADAIDAAWRYLALSSIDHENRRAGVESLRTSLVLKNAFQMRRWLDVDVRS